MFFQVACDKLQSGSYFGSLRRESDLRRKHQCPGEGFAVGFESLMQSRCLQRREGFEVCGVYARSALTLGDQRLFILADSPSVKGYNRTFFAQQFVGVGREEAHVWLEMAKWN